jgi:hypothetical protein
MLANKSPLPNPVTKIYIRVNYGMVTDVYSSNPNVEVELIDLDRQIAVMDDKDRQIRERVGKDIYVVY